MFKLALFFSIPILSFSGTASACGLSEIVGGLCPGSLGFLDDADSGDRAALIKRYAWTNLNESNSKGKMDLLICAFIAPAPVISEAEKKLEKIDFSKRVKRWNLLLDQVESQAQQWNVPQKSALGVVRTSRLRFVFRQESGEFRTCEDFPDSHIRISFVRNANFSVYGTQAWTYRLNASSEVQASMVLQPSAIEAGSGTVQHEFGHALGFIHEMHHPSWRECSEDFKLALFLKDNPNLYPSAKNTTQMEEMARDNLVESEFGEKELASSYEFDRESVMTYVIGEEYFDRKSCAFPNDISRISLEDYAKYLDVYAIQ
jgi:hypothetical protein